MCRCIMWKSCLIFEETVINCINYLLNMCTIKSDVQFFLTQKGDMIDARDPKMGAWFEAKVMDVSFTDESDPSSILYHVVYDG